MSQKSKLRERAREILDLIDEIDQELADNPELEDFLQDERKCITCGSYDYEAAKKKNIKGKVIECSNCTGGFIH